MNRSSAKEERPEIASIFLIGNPRLSHMFGAASGRKKTHSQLALDVALRQNKLVAPRSLASVRQLGLELST